LIYKIDPNLKGLYAPDFSPYKKLDPQKGILMVGADPFSPDPCVPKHVIDAMKTALDEGKTHYMSRLPQLTEKIADKLYNFNGLSVDPDKEIMVTPGSAFALFAAIRLFIDPMKEDEVLNPDPSFAENFNDVHLAGAKNIYVPLKEEQNYQIDIEEFEKRLTERTKLVVLTNPNNPTTTVFNRKSLEVLADFVIRYDLILVADQNFERLVFDDQEYVTIATLPGMKERTLTVFSFSKDSALPGMRIGYLVASEYLIDISRRCRFNYVGAANTIGLYGALAALENPSFIKEWKDIYDERRKIGHRILNDVSGVTCLLPESSFFLWVNISELGTSDEVVEYLIKHANVGVAPGYWFGPRGEGYLRIITGVLKDTKKYTQAIERIAEALNKLSSDKNSRKKELIK